jgi:starvation-inducible DNA-binding protein
MASTLVTDTRAPETIVTRMKTVHADTTVLYFKLRAYHWNVTGDHFFQLHALFEKLYQEMADINDILAERLVAIGAAPMVTLAEQLRTSLVQEDPLPRSATMTANILSDLKLLTGSLRELAQEANAGHDVATMNLADSTADSLENTIWMLSAFLRKN